MLVKRKNHRRQGVTTDLDFPSKVRKKIFFDPDDDVNDDDDDNDDEQQ